MNNYVMIDMVSVEHEIKGKSINQLLGGARNWNVSLSNIKLMCSLCILLIYDVGLRSKYGNTKNRKYEMKFAARFQYNTRPVSRAVACSEKLVCNK